MKPSKNVVQGAILSTIRLMSFLILILQLQCVLTDNLSR